MLSKCSDEGLARLTVVESAERRAVHTYMLRNIGNADLALVVAADEYLYLLQPLLGFRLV